MTNTAKTTSPIRRTFAGIAAAVTIAVGGLSMVSTADANAAGVHATNYAIQATTVTAPTAVKKSA